MNLESLRELAKDGPQNVQQRAVLLTMACLSREDNTIEIDSRALLRIIDIPTRNMSFTLNELIKKGWLELLSSGNYRIDPSGGLRLSVDETYMDTNKWGSSGDLL
jgi:hypothetical protein